MKKDFNLEDNMLKGIALKLRKLSDSDKASDTKMLRFANLTASGYTRLIEVESCSLTTLARLSVYYEKPITYWFNEDAIALYHDKIPELDLPDNVRTYADIELELNNLRDLTERQRQEIEQLKGS